MYFLKWQTEWKTFHRNAKLFPIKKTITKWPTAYRKKRREEVILARIRIGQTVSLTSPGMKTSQTCETCFTPLTTQHIFQKCPLHPSL